MIRIKTTGEEDDSLKMAMITRKMIVVQVVELWVVSMRTWMLMFATPAAASCSYLPSSSFLLFRPPPEGGRGRREGREGGVEVGVGGGWSRERQT